jgi:hypothetical protein
MASRGHLLLALLVLAATAAAASGGRHQARVRRPARPRLELVPAAPDASLADRARDDVHRHAYIRSQLASRRGRRAAEVGASAFAMPLSSGAYTGTGQYFVRFRVGTPAQPFVLVADTGSDLTWVKCRGAGAVAGTGAGSPARVFRTAASKSWAPIACFSDTCTSYVPFSLANCSSPASPCAYDYRSVLSISPASLPMPSSHCPPSYSADRSPRAARPTGTHACSALHRISSSSRYGLLGGWLRFRWRHGRPGWLCCPNSPSRQRQ